MLSPTEAAYIAAVLDSEGTLTVLRTKHRTSGRPTFQVRVMAVNADSRLIFYLLDKAGGRSYSQQPSNPRWSRMHRWQLVGDGARELLRQVRPYLQLKGELADLLLVFPKRQTGWPGSKQTEVLAEQERITTEIRELNRRGA